GIVHFNGGTLRLSEDQAALFDGFETGNVTLDQAGGTIDTQDYTVAAVADIDGPGTLTKKGTGTLALTGANTYSGGTTIEEGTLLLSEAAEGLSALGTSDVFVDIGGRLAGTGRILGDTIVAGAMSPGNSPGLITFDGDLILESTASLVFELGGYERGLDYDA